ncbi:Xylose operon regulatory protein [Novipirellula galeiformis]|uniref:Xylose operon regulatory protein n=1 Tax=Novipirellula galeiformis TaxID=2528004 RepID=A0A5C6CR73_9BACT|nr:DNA-binding transcriptional regulator [Novipirellula galeiformis]TWU25349.1 Xylose operon regulatory protein [Novipirellula galeiformis]
MLKKKRVALMIETSTIYGRQLLEGVIRFRRTHHDWSIFLEQRDLTAKPPAWLANWTGNGIISRVTTAEFAKTVRHNGIPMVELTDRGQDFGFPVIRSDDAEIGRLAAEHLTERGFQNFAFCGFQSEEWSTLREQAFVRHAPASTQACEIYRSIWQGEEARSAEDEQAELLKWLLGLPKPVGIFCCNDVRGQQVLEACAQSELVIPEEVAVIGTDNDRVLCELCDPSLSSVIPNAEEIGFQAAELLARLMAGEAAENKLHLIPPLGIQVRQSSDIVAIDDPSIAAALSYIREQACDGITVQNVINHSGLSRSTLERQLRKLLGRSPQQEIRHVQIKRARRLLTETDLPMERIASLCGFDHPEYMHVVFRRETKMTPGQYRRSPKGNP